MFDHHKSTQKFLIDSKTINLQNLENTRLEVTRKNHYPIQQPENPQLPQLLSIAFNDLDI